MNTTDYLRDRYGLVMTHAQVAEVFQLTSKTLSNSLLHQKFPGLTKIPNTNRYHVSVVARVLDQLAAGGQN